METTQTTRVTTENIMQTNNTIATLTLGLLLGLSTSFLQGCAFGQGKWMTCGSPEHVAARRLNPLLDRMELKGAEFHRHVRQGFLDQARSQAQRYIVIDASADADAVFQNLLMSLQSRWATSGLPRGAP